MKPIKTIEKTFDHHNSIAFVWAIDQMRDELAWLSKRSSVCLARRFWKTNAIISKGYPGMGIWRKETISSCFRKEQTEKFEKAINFSHRTFDLWELLHKYLVMFRVLSSEMWIDGDGTEPLREQIEIPCGPVRKSLNEEWSRQQGNETSTKTALVDKSQCAKQMIIA
jgi:hypothetical protein